jgi:hypothetical protein
MKFNVTVYFIGANRSQTLKTTRPFPNSTAALRYIENELSYEDTRRVVCKELDIDREGDFEFTR